MKKILKKIRFILDVVMLGAGIRSKAVLLIESIRIQKNFYMKKENHPFSCWIGNKKRKARVHFQGNLDDMHALTEIFVERCYDPGATHEVSTILDLGANIGLFSVWAWLTFPHCTIHAYEPDPSVYALLVKNLSGLSNVQTFNMAIADTEGSIKFYVSERSFSSSIHPVSSREVIDINVKKLDTVIRDSGGRIDLVKMDIEGAEFSVLEHSNTVGNIEVIVGEVHPEKAGEDIATFVKTLEKTHQIENNIVSGKSLFKAVRKF